MLYLLWFRIALQICDSFGHRLMHAIGGSKWE